MADKKFSPKFFDTEGSFGKFQRIIHWVTSVLEAVLSIALIVGIIFSFVKLPGLVYSVTKNGASAVQSLVNYVAIIIIAIELIHVINSQNLESVIEILMMAFTRELVIREWSVFQLLLGVLCIAGLFAVKKFFIDKKN